MPSRAIEVIDVEVTTSHLVRHSLEVTEGVRYFERHCLETEGPDEVVDKDCSDDALGIFDIASPSIVFRKFERDRFDGVVDVSIGDVDASLEDVVQDGGVEHSVVAESVETANALHDVEGAFVGEDAFGSFKGATIKVVDLSKPVERADKLVAGSEVVNRTVVRLFGGRLVVGVVLLESIRTPVKVGCALGVSLFDELSSHSAESADLPSTALTSHANT